MMKPVRYALYTAAVLLVGAQFVRPARTNPLTDPARTLAARVTVTPAVTAVLERACRDCHSNDTSWPWYSNVAPVSWLVIDHVNHGRRHFNYSDWQLDAEKGRKVVHDICEQVRDHEMPIGSYLLVHRDARLSDNDVQTLCDWTASVKIAAAHQP